MYLILYSPLIIAAIIDVTERSLRKLRWKRQLANERNQP